MFVRDPSIHGSDFNEFQVEFRLDRLRKNAPEITECSGWKGNKPKCIEGNHILCKLYIYCLNVFSL